MYIVVVKGASQPIKELQKLVLVVDQMLLQFFREKFSEIPKLLRYQV